MTVTFTEAANRDLVEISSYLLQYGQYALSFSQDMDAAIAHLERRPDSGAQRNDLSKNAKTRFWRMGRYLIVYARYPDHLAILAVLHTSRNIRGELRRRSGKSSK